jgi:mRNA-degrading endonuclease toxin of MazEF toxin-antitoxin module
MSDPGFGPSASSARPIAQPTATPRDRLGSRLGRIDPEAIARAEAALKGLSSQFGQWLQDELGKLKTARSAIEDRGLTQASIDQLYTHAHDLKGLGSTYGFPIVTDIAASLCRLLGEAEMRLSVPMDLLDAHIDTIGACVCDNIKTPETPAGHALICALQVRVDQHLKTL